ncbi:MAG: hypothetical protein N3A61_08620 [Ignavibacteria bacterium]|nr:hypothetical protein [Ignavibacteria bacterium]
MNSKAVKIFLVALFFQFTAYAKDQVKYKVDKNLLSDLRHKFYSAVQSEKELFALEQLLKKNFPEEEKHPPIIIAFKGGVEALKGKHAFWPISKYSYLVEAMKILEQAIKLAPNDIEVRFMRFSILSHIPSILGYNKEKIEDRNVLVRLLLKKDFSQLDENIQKGIVQFMIDSDLLTKTQLKIFAENFSFAKFNE